MRAFVPLALLLAAQAAGASEEVALILPWPTLVTSPAVAAAGASEELAVGSSWATALMSQAVAVVASPCHPAV